jgi:hypothetical protein
MKVGLKEVVGTIEHTMATSITKGATTGIVRVLATAASIAINTAAIAGTKASAGAVVQISPRDLSTTPKIGLSKPEAIVSSEVAGKLEAAAAISIAGISQPGVAEVGTGSRAPILAESEGHEYPRRVECERCSFAFAPKPNWGRCQRRY